MGETMSTQRFPILPAAALALSVGFFTALQPATGQVTDGTPEPIMIALPLAGATQDGPGCKMAEDLVDDAARAYGLHLSARFNTQVELCLFETPGEAVAMAGRGEANLVWVDQSSAEPILESWRSSLTLRPDTGLGRPPFVLFTRVQEGQSIQIETLSGDQIGFLDRLPTDLNIDLAQDILRDYGLNAESLEESALFPSIDALFKAVEDGVVQAAILEAGSWGRSCAVLEPDSTICDGFDVLMYDRPRALNALMIPRTTSNERHYRLVGVHIALHLEQPEAFAWLSQGLGQEFDPTEPNAMVPKSPARAIVF